MSISSLKLPRVIGHRGACGYAPENTLASMRKAHELGVKSVEFDVMLTGDGQAIIMHDETLDRTTNGRGKVAEAALSQIKKLDAGSWFNKKFVNERVPTFIELLQLLADLNLHMNVEIKPTLGNEVATAQKTLEILQTDWSFKTSMPLISSAKELSLTTAYNINPKLLYGFISDHWLENWQQKLAELHCISFHVNHRELTPAKVTQVKQEKKYLLAYTVNDPARAQELFSWGVDAVFSDFPDKILVESHSERSEESEF